MCLDCPHRFLSSPNPQRHPVHSWNHHDPLSLLQGQRPLWSPDALRRRMVTPREPRLIRTVYPVHRWILVANTHPCLPYTCELLPLWADRTRCFPPRSDRFTCSCYSRPRICWQVLVPFGILARFILLCILLTLMFYVYTGYTDVFMWYCCYELANWGYVRSTIFIQAFHFKVANGILNIPCSDSGYLKPVKP
jgi:hypothetical protein